MVSRNDGASQREAFNPTAQPSAEPNTDVALDFLEGLDPKGRHDLTAIWAGNITTASFDAGDRERMRKWIDARQGKANLYYSVNEAKPDARRDNKLRKDEIGNIRALMLDLDPTKVKGGDPTGQHFLRERERLLSVVEGAANDAQCPPTLTINSGGGFQLAWQLEPTVPAEGNIELVEGIARTISARFGGDNTWNLDRIMRLPGTVNMPTPDKAAQGRTPATAKVLPQYSRGTSYTLEQLEKWAPPTPTAEKAWKAKADGSNVVELGVAQPGATNPVNWDVVQNAKAYDGLPLGLRKTFEGACKRDHVLRALYEDGVLPPGHTDESGSGYSFALARYLKPAGEFTPTQFGQLLWVWPHGPDHAKMNARMVWRDWQNAPEDDPWGPPADLWAGDSKPPKLPKDAVPEIVDRLARDWGRRLGVEPGAPAAALVTALGSLVSAGNTMQLRQRDTGWKVKPPTWTAIIGEPGSNKSATISRAIEPVEYVEARWRRAHAAAKDAAKAQSAIAKAKGAAAPASERLPGTPEELFGGATPASTIVPFRQKIVNDTTTEGLAHVLANQPSGVLCHVCGFRRLRPGIPIERGHAFRSKAATCSEEGGRGVVAGMVS